MDTLKENQIYIENDGKDSGDEGSDDDDEDLEDDDGNDSAKEFEKTNQMISKFGAKLHRGDNLTKEELAEITLNDPEDDDDDEFNLEDMDEEDELYDSRLDDVDELTILKQTLEEINNRDANEYGSLTQGIQNIGEFTEIMSGVETLI